jgi:hypothetical protein
MKVQLVTVALPTVLRLGSSCAPHRCHQYRAIGQGTGSAQHEKRGLRFRRPQPSLAGILFQVMAGVLARIVGRLFRLVVVVRFEAEHLPLRLA